jgi:Leucine-rich repeat (LRR) protein
LIIELNFDKFDNIIKNKATTKKLKKKKTLGKTSLIREIHDLNKKYVKITYLSCVLNHEVRISRSFLLLVFFSFNVVSFLSLLPFPHLIFSLLIELYVLNTHSFIYLAVNLGFSQGF